MDEIETTEIETTEKSESTGFKLLKFGAGVIVASFASKLVERGLDSLAARRNKTETTETTTE